MARTPVQYCVTVEALSCFTTLSKKKIHEMIEEGHLDLHNPLSIAIFLRLWGTREVRQVLADAAMDRPPPSPSRVAQCLQGHAGRARIRQTLPAQHFYTLRTLYSFTQNTNNATYAHVSRKNLDPSNLVSVGVFLVRHATREVRDILVNATKHSPPKPDLVARVFRHCQRAGRLRDR